MLNLIKLFQNTTPSQTANNPSRNYPNDTKPTAIKFDESTIQSSFAFEKSPNIVFVKNITTLVPTDLYEDLPQIVLTPEEKQIRLQCIEEQKVKNPKFFDGMQMVLTNIIYDENSNTVYLEARQVPYSFVVALSNKKFPEDSALYQLNLYKTGALAPLVTRDGQTMLMQRAAHGLYSVPAGFLEPLDKVKRLNFYDGRNLVTETARNELKEELLGIKDSDALRFETSAPQIASVSFRKTAGIPIGTIEFVVPSYADCHSSFLEYVFQTNSAQDAHEHTSLSKMLPLASQDRTTLIEHLLTGTFTLPGASLYLPVAVVLAGLENLGKMAFPRSIPNSSSIVWPLSFFAAQPSRSLPAPDDKKNEVALRNLSI